MTKLQNNFVVTTFFKIFLYLQNTFFTEHLRRTFYVFYLFLLLLFFLGKKSILREEERSFFKLFLKKVFRQTAQQINRRILMEISYFEEVAMQLDCISSTTSLKQLFCVDVLLYSCCTKNFWETLILE